MNIRKHIEDYSRDIQLVYNSDATKENYKSQVWSFLNYFKNEVEPKAISNEKIKEWLLEAKTINSRKHRLCAVNSFYKITVGMSTKIQKIPYPKSEKKLPIVLSQDEVQKMFDVCENTKEEQCTCKEHDPYCCQIHGNCPTCLKKEEPKQELKPLEVPMPIYKQETVEEACERMYPNDLHLKRAFRNGARLQQQNYGLLEIELNHTKTLLASCEKALEDRDKQQERMYSEEDMRKCWNTAYIDAMSLDEETYKPFFFEDFIEQFKKK